MSESTARAAARPVAVLGGGPSAEHEVSLQTSAAVLDALRAGGVSARPLLITQDGLWIPGADGDAWSDLERSGPSLSASACLEQLRKRDEVAFLGLHGRFGEDGQIQRLLAAAGVPYTGSGPIPSALCFDKDLSKLAATRLGARCATHVVLGPGAPVATALLARDVGLPCVVKPVAGGSSVATSIVSAESELRPAVDRARAEDAEGRAMVEGFVAGIEVTAAVLRLGERVECLPLVSIEPVGDPFYDYHAKYESDATRLTCPALVSDATRAEIMRVADALYTQLDLRGVARADFIVDAEQGRPSFLEINTLPGLTTHSLVPAAGAASDRSLFDMLSAVLADASHDDSAP